MENPSINKATLAKKVDDNILYIYPKTSADIVVYDDSKSVRDAISILNENKVDKIQGKGLSTNDFTDVYRRKLDDLGDVTEVITGAASTVITESLTPNRILISDNSGKIGEADYLRINIQNDRIDISKNINLTGTTTINGITGAEIAALSGIDINENIEGRLANVEENYAKVRQSGASANDTTDYYILFSDQYNSINTVKKYEDLKYNVNKKVLYTPEIHTSNITFDAPISGFSNINDIADSLNDAYNTIHGTNLFGVCTSNSADVIKTVNINGYTGKDGEIITVVFNNGFKYSDSNTSYSLNVNSIGNRPILKYSKTNAYFYPSDISSSAIDGFVGVPIRFLCRTIDSNEYFIMLGTESIVSHHAYEAEKFATATIGGTSAPIYINHDGEPEVVGSVDVAHGGTGTTSLNPGEVLIGNRTGPVTTKKIETTIKDNSNLITSGAVYDTFPLGREVIHEGNSISVSLNYPEKIFDDGVYLNTTFACEHGARYIGTGSTSKSYDPNTISRSTKFKNATILPNYGTHYFENIGFDNTELSSPLMTLSSNNYNESMWNSEGRAYYFKNCTFNLRDGIVDFDISAPCSITFDSCIFRMLVSSAGRDCKHIVDFNCAHHHIFDGNYKFDCYVKAINCAFICARDKNSDKTDMVFCTSNGYNILIDNCEFHDVVPARFTNSLDYNGLTMNNCRLFDVDSIGNTTFYDTMHGYTKISNCIIDNNYNYGTLIYATGKFGMISSCIINKARIYSGCRIFYEHDCIGDISRELLINTASYMYTIGSTTSSL